MTSVVTTWTSGVSLLAIGVAMAVWLLWLAPQVYTNGDTAGLVVLLVLSVPIGAAVLWGAHLLYYKKTIVLDDKAAHVHVRGLFGTASRSTPLNDYGAILQIDSHIQWWKFSSLILADRDPRFTVCLAMTNRGSDALSELHAHFSRLLRLRVQQTSK